MREQHTENLLYCFFGLFFLNTTFCEYYGSAAALRLPTTAACCHLSLSHIIRWSVTQAVVVLSGRQQCLREKEVFPQNYMMWPLTNGRSLPLKDGIWHLSLAIFATVNSKSLEPSGGCRLHTCLNWLNERGHLFYGERAPRVRPASVRRSILLCLYQQVEVQSLRSHQASVIVMRAMLPPPMMYANFSHTITMLIWKARQKNTKQNLDI